MLPHSRSSWGFLTFCLFAAVFYFVRAIPVAYRFGWERSLFFILLSFAFFPCLHFLGTCSPFKILWPKLRRALPIAGVYGGLLLIAHYLFGSGFFFILWGGSILVLLSVLLFSEQILRLTRVPPTASDHQRGIILRLAIFLAFAPLVLYLVVRTWTRSGPDFQIYFEMPAVAFPLVMSYAVTRGNFLRLNEFLKEGLLFTFLMAMLGGTTALIVGAAIPLAERLLPGSSSIWTTAAFAGCVAWLASPFYSRARQVLADRFNRAHSAYDQLLNEVRGLGETLPDPKALCEAVVTSLSRLSRSPHVALLLYDESTGKFSVGGATWVIPSQAGFLQEASVLGPLAERFPDGISRDDLVDRLDVIGGSQFSADVLQRLQATWLFPLLIENRTIGLCVVGDKADLSNFSRSEIEKLRQVIREAALGVYGFGVRQRMVEKQLAEEALEESEDRFRRLVENSPDVIYRYKFRPVEGLDYISPGISLLIQRSPQEFSENPRLFKEIVHPEDRDLVLASPSRAEVYPPHRELRWMRKDGGFVWIEERRVPIFDRDGILVALEATVRDITERKRAEELEGQLLHRQKLEAAGTLAAGIAHDFNNLITAISGFTSVAKDTLPYHHPAAEMLVNVERAVLQAKGITHSLLLFTNRIRSEKTPVNLNALISASVGLLRRILPASIEFDSDIPDQPQAWVWGDETQLQQVLMNLVINARDAMPKGGQLTISLRVEEMRASSDAEGLGRVLLIVEDTGVGIPPEIRGRIFEPFFTTKSPDQGTGLGLSITHGIVKGHGGEIEVKSAPGRGARFVITLPACPPRVFDPSDLSSDGACLGHGECLLLAEDEDSVRAALTTYLRKMGFRVIACADGSEFCEELANVGDQVDLAIIDIELPKRSGDVCIEKLIEERPGLPIIAITGNARFTLSRSCEHKVNLIRKPFDMTTLIGTVYDLLACAPKERNDDPSNTENESGYERDLQVAQTDPTSNC